MKFYTLAFLIALAPSAGFAREKISLVAEDDWYPYSARAENGRPHGFAVDVIKLAYDAVDADVEYKVMPFARCLEEVKLGREIGCFDTAKQEMLDSDFVFPEEPLFTAKLTIYIPSDSGDKNLTFKKLEGKKVGITNGYTYGDEFEKNQNIKKDVSQSDTIVLKKLAKGRLDSAIVYEKCADYIVGQNKSELEHKIKVGGVGKDDKFYISFSRKHPGAEKAKSLFDKGMKLIKANGKYSELEKKFAEKLKNG